MSSKPDYRADVDGLRALAVLGVVLFHAEISWLPGGFVGVDVFFVISGFLITGIIVSHEGDIRSFVARFYERRIRRLVPPAVPVIVFTTSYAWFILPPAALEEYAQSLLAYTVFSSNWFFLSIAGYFDGPSHFKPLLHTWSLSIEEQFYLLFPIPILLLRRYGERAVAILLIGVFALSFAYSVYLMLTGAIEAAFFNSAARFWEIALGGLLAIGVVRPARSAAFRQVTGTTGLILIVASMLLYGDVVPFPGISALVPTIGTVLLILSVDSFANRALSWRPVVGLGLISYALYLWHWPIFVFIQYSVINASSLHLLAGALVSMALAGVSYVIVERPVRGLLVLPSPTHLTGAFVLFFAACFGVGTPIWLNQGNPNRFPDAAKYAETLKDQLAAHSKERLLISTQK